MTALVFPNTLEQYGSLLYEGAVVELAGKLNFTEDKAPELVCNTVSAPSDPAAVGVSTGKQVRPGYTCALKVSRTPLSEGHAVCGSV